MRGPCLALAAPGISQVFAFDWVQLDIFAAAFGESSKFAYFNSGVGDEYGGAESTHSFHLGVNPEISFR